MSLAVASEEAAATLRVLANATRLAILRAASESEVGVSALAEQVGLSQPATSQHLRCLRDVDLVEVRVDGNHRYYKTRQDRLSDLAGFLNNLWTTDLGALKAAAERKQVVRDTAEATRDE